MRGKLGASIENKILVPFVCISLITVLCFCFILYRTEYSVKIRTETVNAQALVQYINADIDAGGYWTNPWDLVEKYAATYQGDSLFLYTARDEPLFSRRDLGTRSWSWRTARITGWAGGCCTPWTGTRYGWSSLRNSAI